MPQTDSSQNHAAAEAAYLAAVKTRPTAELWQRLGLVRHLQNKFELAIPAFQSALALDPNLWTARLFLGIGLYRTNRFEEAEASLRHADRLAPLDAPGRVDVDFWLGAALIARHQTVEGLRHVEKVLARDPKHLEALELATRTYADAASALWNEVAEKHFETAAGWEVHGHALESEGNLPQAIEAFRRSQAIAPNRAGPGLKIGQLLLREGKAREALAELRRELGRRGAEPETGLYAGLAAIQSADFASALPLLNIAEKKQPRNAEIPLALTQACLALGRISDAATAARRARELAPTSTAAHELLVVTLSQMGATEELTQEKLRWERLREKR